MDATPARYPLREQKSYSKCKLPNGEIVTGNSRAHLRQVAYQRCAELDLLKDIPNFPRFFLNAICEALPPDRACNECRYVEEDSPEFLKKERILRMDDVRRFLRTVREFAAAGGQYVEQEEAERRALICAQCPLNQEVTGCAGCSGLVNEIFEVLGKARTRYDDSLRGCAVCGCELKSKVFMPQEVLDRGGDNFTYPAHCWRRKE